ncbi:hypothetical protein Tco_0992172 [Tanacetum coccineum]|uniref:Uncharacterized protein n=1 Tax=Tanacetum coccineum TaxID=301880 RepID=A0ABQ5F1D9_9ASTR
MERGSLRYGITDWDRGSLGTLNSVRWELLRWIMSRKCGNSFNSLERYVCEGEAFTTRYSTRKGCVLQRTSRIPKIVRKANESLNGIQGKMDVWKDSSLVFRGLIDFNLVLDFCFVKGQGPATPLRNYRRRITGDIMSIVLFAGVMRPSHQRSNFSNVPERDRLTDRSNEESPVVEPEKRQSGKEEATGGTIESSVPTKEQTNRPVTRREVKDICKAGSMWTKWSSVESWEERDETSFGKIDWKYASGMKELSEEDINEIHSHRAPSHSMYYWGDGLRY